MKKKKLYMRARAEEIYKQCNQESLVSNYEVTKLIDELTLYQLELEIQNEDLLKIQIDLEESQSKYIDLYDLAPIGYFSINKEGLINEVNIAGCQLLGLNKQALINRCFSRYIVPEDKTLFAEYRLRAFKEMTLQSFELKLLSWNQPAFHASFQCKVIENSRTGHRQLLTFITDISARKHAENSLHLDRMKMAVIDRLRSLNELVYGIAYDQNNSLTIINNYLHGSIRRLETGTYQADELLHTLKKAVSASYALEEVIKKRKSSTAKTIFRYEYTNMNTIISRTISLLSHEVLDFPVMIQYEPMHNFCKVKLDQYHIQHTLLNIARNAIEAMRDSNTKEPKLLIETLQKNKDTVEVVISDNGPGLIKDSIPRLFEPHYTTKSYGVGLGLTVSRAIIEKHGGELFALSNPSGGACVGFTLPCVAY